MTKGSPFNTDSDFRTDTKKKILWKDRAVIKRLLRKAKSLAKRLTL